MSEKTREALGVSAALLIGIAAFFVFAGWWVLIPTNIGWLDVRDRAMHTLGWFFYRDAPWGTPPGDSPNLGIELANSIGLVDGLPLFAIPLKLASAWLPRPFQYWGYWWLLCFSLQSLFGYRLARAMGAARPVAVLAGAFVLITPAFLFRVTLHMALAGHWTLLAALWLYARREPPKSWMWPLLMALTASIHAYLFVIAGGIWFASWLQRLWQRALPARTAIAEPVAIAIFSGVVLWAAGFFYTGTLGGIGYGYYRLNLLGPILTQGWSALVPSLPHTYYDYEGLSFLGVGIFGALLVSILSGSIVAIREIFTRRWFPLIVLCVLFCLFALSDTIGIFDRETAPIPLPGFVIFLGHTFRSTGRFVWPLLYLVTVGAVVLAAQKLTVRAATIVLGLLFVLQTADSHWYWSSFRRSIPAPSETWRTPLTSPFWDRATSAGFNRVRAIPVVSLNPGWRRLEYYALTHGMDVDAIYLGRVDEGAVTRLAAAENTAIETGNFEPHTLYIVDLATAQRIAPKLGPTDLLATIDGRIVFARAGAWLVEGLGIEPQHAVSAPTWLPASVPPTTSP